jgi:hypothetical protein
MQRALTTLEQREIVTGSKGAYRLAEPFLAEWLKAGGVRGELARYASSVPS